VGSPTFTLVREYQGRVPIRHIDLYRLEPDDLPDLGWRDLLYGNAVSVIEWADKAAGTLPDARYEVEIHPDADCVSNRRLITVSPPRDVDAAPTPGQDGQARPSAAHEGEPKTRAHEPPPSPRTRVLRPEGATGYPSRVVGIDTSARTRSIGLLSEGEIRELLWGPGDGELLAEDLASSLRGLFDEAGVTVRDLELVTVALGPGSFTGVKVGLAAAKALSWALGLPLKGAGTLDVLAAGALAARGRGCRYGVMVLTDARRGEVFGAAYLGSPRPLPLQGGNGAYIHGPPPSVVAVLADALAEAFACAVADEEAPPPGLRRPAGTAQARGPEIVLAGDSAEQSAGDVREALARHGLELHRADGQADWDGRDALECVYPRAGDLIMLGRARFLNERGDDPFSLLPTYLKEPDISLPTGGNRTPSRGSGNRTGSRGGERR